MADMTHGRPSSMMAYRPQGPEQAQTTGPTQGMMAQLANFTQPDQAAEENLARYTAQARQGADVYGATVNSHGAEYQETDLFNGALFGRIEREA